VSPETGDGISRALEQNRQEAVITVAELGEFGLIAAIQSLLPADDTLAVADGDDAAVLLIPDGRVVATTDLLVEGRHFRRDWSGPADVGVKAAAQNMADVAAMGARPRTLLVGLACPGELPAEWVLEMMRGLVAECRRGGASVAGGDVTAAGSIMLGITALGDLAGLAPVVRGGARPGDQVAIAGRIGWSAAGLALFRAGLVAGTAAAGAGAAAAGGAGAAGAGAAGTAGVGGPGGLGAALESAVAAHRRPQPPYSAGPAAAIAGATAMADVSDGLLQDLGHIAAASGVGIDLDAAALPASAPVTAAAAALGARWQDWVLGGGEDHALVATFPPQTALPPGWTAIGTARPGDGVTVDGAVWNGPAGWDHFR
jgi:thiamine-monophosphate kinase